jgi:hypothetical protein
MLKSYRMRVGLVVLGFLGAVTVCLLLITKRPPACPLALLFERYGTFTTLDSGVNDVAYLSLTNSSDTTYCFALDGTNTFTSDGPPGFNIYKLQHPSPAEMSYRAKYEFRDKTPTGIPTGKQRVSFASLGECMGIAPHASVRLRVALPPEGQKRKLAALCVALPVPTTRPFWSSSLGGTILRLLPRSLAQQAMHREPPVLRVWCDHELVHGPAVASQQ